MTAVYIITNHVVNRKLSKKGGKMFAFFADLKVALERKLLNEMMRKMQVENNLREQFQRTLTELWRCIKKQEI